MRLGSLPIIALLLAGCIGGGNSTVTLDNDELAAAEGDARVDCLDQGTLTIAIARIDSGSVRVRVLDGDGAEVFIDVFEQREAGTIDHGLFGAPGTWRLQANGTFQGRITATLAC